VLRRIFGPDGERERARERGEGEKMRRWRMFVTSVFMKGYLRPHEYDCEGHIVLQIHNLLSSPNVVIIQQS